MYYVIDKTDLWNRTYEEVSRVADEAYGEDGTPLYDSIILTERDREMVSRFIDDAASLMVRRCFDICKYSPETTTDENNQTQLTGRMRLLFHVPDLDTSMEPSIQEEISRYLALYAATSIFQSRRAAVVPQYTERVQAAMDRAVVLLKSRKAPNERW